MNTLSACAPSTVLHETFGFDAFRPHQQELIEALLAGKDAFGVMPTGGGKSLCYQLPAVAMDGCAVVVSPLIALMKDQVDAARANGIRAACINSAASDDDRRAAARDYHAGELDLLYLAPERIALAGFLDRLRDCPSGAPAFFAIDEAHCLSEWGHDFRPDYLVLQSLRDAFPGTPLAAFTATATERVADDIAARLQLRDPARVRASFDRPNLFYEAQQKSDPETQILEFVKARPGQAGIVYRTSRRSVEATADILRANGIDAHAYHAGMESAERTRVQDAFIHDDAAVIVATIAFGMGIDKADVRYVIHGDLPKNIESYYQETGRAGRDGEPSHCLLLHSPADAAKQRRFLAEVDDGAERLRLLALVGAMERFATVATCRREGLLGYFGEVYRRPKGEDGCGSCDFCIGSFEEVEATRDAQIMLSAMLRTGERFGSAHLCDIVMGNRTPKVQQHRHDELKTFGVGQDRPKPHWRGTLDALLAAGATSIAEGGYGNPRITDLGWTIVKGDRGFSLYRDTRQSARPNSASGRRNRSSAPVFSYHEGLFEHLRSVRKTLADGAGIPPYAVFSDRTLREMAATMPTDDAGLTALHGIGTHKRDTYGHVFLAAVADYLQSDPEATSQRITPSEIARVPVPERGAPSDTVSTTLAMVRAGLDAPTIAARRGLAVGTVESHIAELIESGSDGLSVEQFIPQDVAILARQLFEKHGVDAVKPIVGASGGSISYGQAKIVRAGLPKEAIC